ncbi:MAG: DUF669 domain-containing protein [Magnetococcales bacterium]|nr:DUF669 domain-containing protein [Magnetococcales bacterium]
MAQLGGTFDASQVDPSQPQETLPPGDYRVQIINSEMRVTKAGSGQYLWMEMDVLDGPMAGRKLFDRLNLINPNRQAEEIAQRTLSAICHAVGRMQVSDSEELHFKPLMVKVTVGKDGYNEVKGYKPATTSTAQFQRPGQGYAAAPRIQPSQAASSPVYQPQQAVQPQVYQQPQAAPAPVYQQPQAAPAPVYQQPTPPQATPALQPEQTPPAQPPVQAPTGNGVGPWRRMG